MVFDARCPRCNQITVGCDDVAAEVPERLPTSCRHCHVNLRLVEVNDGIPTACFDIWEPWVGDFVEEHLVTDTRVYEVVGRTASTMKVRLCQRGEIVKRSSDPYPRVWNEALRDDSVNNLIKTVRLRKDGTFRMGQGFNPLVPATVIEGKPCFFTDYQV